MAAKPKFIDAISLLKKLDSSPTSVRDWNQKFCTRENINGGDYSQLPVIVNKNSEVFLIKCAVRVGIFVGAIVSKIHTVTDVTGRIARDEQLFTHLEIQGHDEKAYLEWLEIAPDKGVLLLQDSIDDASSDAAVGDYVITEPIQNPEVLNDTRLHKKDLFYTSQFSDERGEEIPILPIGPIFAKVTKGGRDSISARVLFDSYFPYIVPNGYKEDPDISEYTKHKLGNESEIIIQWRNTFRTWRVNASTIKIDTVKEHLLHCGRRLSGLVFDLPDSGPGRPHLILGPTPGAVPTFTTREGPVISLQCIDLSLDTYPVTKRLISLDWFVDNADKAENYTNPGMGVQYKGVLDFIFQLGTSFTAAVLDQKTTSFITAINSTGGPFDAFRQTYLDLITRYFKRVASEEVAKNYQSFALRFVSNPVKVTPPKGTPKKDTPKPPGEGRPRKEPEQEERREEEREEEEREEQDSDSTDSQQSATSPEDTDVIDAEIEVVNEKLERAVEARRESKSDVRSAKEIALGKRLLELYNRRSEIVHRRAMTPSTKGSGSTAPAARQYYADVNSAQPLDLSTASRAENPVMSVPIDLRLAVFDSKRSSPEWEGLFYGFPGYTDDTATFINYTTDISNGSADVIEELEDSAPRGKFDGPRLIPIDGTLRVYFSGNIVSTFYDLSGFTDDVLAVDFSNTPIRGTKFDGRTLNNIDVRVYLGHPPSGSEGYTVTGLIVNLDIEPTV